jgi:hypothetical protein
MDIADVLDINKFLEKNLPKDFVPEFTPVEISLFGKLVYTTTSNLSRKSGYYIIPQDNMFYYFKIGDIVPKGEYLFQIDGKGPPVLREGMVVIEKEIYYITLEDIKRGIIRKSRKLKLKPGTITYEDFLNGTTGPTEKAPAQSKARDRQVKATKNSEGTGSGEGSEGSPKTGVSDFPVADRLNGIKNTKLERLSQAAGMDESKIVDLAVENEMRALLNYTSEKEGTGGEDWEVEENP